MTFSRALETVLEGLASATDEAGRIGLGPRASAALRDFMLSAIGTATALEKLAGVDQGNAGLIAFAKSGEPRPSAEIFDVSEILGREQASRHAAEKGTVAKVYAFPTVPTITLGDGGAA